VLVLREVYTGANSFDWCFLFRPDLGLAFQSDLSHLLDAPAPLRAANVVPLDFGGDPTDEPVVIEWMPAASLYFRDPHGNMLEFLSMLPDSPQPELGIVSWSRWNQIHEPVQGQPMA
jgi:lactoylglutathione lyase